MTASDNEQPTMSKIQSIGGFTSRPARIEDAPAMILVEDQASAAQRGEEIPERVLYPSNIDRIEKLMQNPTTWSQVVFDGEELVGYILGRPARDPKTNEDLPLRGHVDSLMVKPDHWNRGIGGGLLDWSFDAMRQQDATELDLWTGVENQLARPLYEHKGFSITGATRICPDPARPEPQVEYLKQL